MAVLVLRSNLLPSALATISDIHSLTAVAVLSLPKSRLPFGEVCMTSKQTVTRCWPHCQPTWHWMCYCLLHCQNRHQSENKCTAHEVECAWQQSPHDCAALLCEPVDSQTKRLWPSALENIAGRKTSVHRCLAGSTAPLIALRAAIPYSVAKDCLFRRLSLLREIGLMCCAYSLCL